MRQALEGRIEKACVANIIEATPAARGDRVAIVVDAIFKAGILTGRLAFGLVTNLPVSSLTLSIAVIYGLTLGAAGRPGWCGTGSTRTPQ